MQILRSTLFVLTILTLTACSSLKFPGVYRIAIQQGNYVDESMVEQLKKGMNRQQVRYVLGTPMVEDSFNQDRWDYYFNVKQGDKELNKKHFIVYFENDLLARWEGDYTEGKEQKKEHAEALKNTKKSEDAKLD